MFMQTVSDFTKQFKLLLSFQINNELFVLRRQGEVIDGVATQVGKGAGENKEVKHPFLLAQQILLFPETFLPYNYL